MHEIELLKEIVIIFGLASIAIYLFNRMKLPSVIGFLLTGVVAGPYGFGLVSSIHDINIFAEFGVILLLFTIGIEFSIKKLIKIKNIVILGGALQVLLSIGITFLILYFFDLELSAAIFIGFLVALSSTAIVLKTLQERDQLDTHHGKIALGILIFQDIIIVPMILLVPFLKGEADNLVLDLGIMLGKSITLLVLTFVLARWVIPFVLHKIAISNSQELFLISIIAIGFAVASFSSWLGLSLALGAFLAGLAISESEYSHQAFGNLIPFRDIFTSFFFVSIGMLLDVQFFLSEFFVIILAVIILMFLKSAIIGFVSFVLGFPFKIALRSGLILSQIGEFSFVLVQIGKSHQLINDQYYQIFLAVAVISMSVTPIFVMFSRKIVSFFEKFPMPEVVRHGFKELPPVNVPELSEHSILVGKTSHIQNIKTSLQMVNVPYVIIDMDADRIRTLQQQGDFAVYGHAQYESVLEHARVKDAKNLLISLGATADNVSIIKMAKKLNENIQVIISTTHIEDMDFLYRSGADYVIPVEFETSLEMFSKALGNYLVSHDEIEKTLGLIRSKGYKALRMIDRVSTRVDIPDFEICTQVVHLDSPAHGKSIRELDLRKKLGVSVLAVKKKDQLITNPDSDIKFEDNDVVYILGNHYENTCVNEVFSHGEKEKEEAS